MPSPSDRVRACRPCSAARCRTRAAGISAARVCRRRERRCAEPPRGRPPRPKREFGIRHDGFLTVTVRRTPDGFRFFRVGNRTAVEFSPCPISYIGHSTTPSEAFLHFAAAPTRSRCLVDVRSAPDPRSPCAPSHFNPKFEVNDEEHGFQYLLYGQRTGRAARRGRVLRRGWTCALRPGGRSDPFFLQGLERLISGGCLALPRGNDVQRRRSHPLPPAAAVGRVLAERGGPFVHIRGTGALQSRRRGPSRANAGGSGGPDGALPGREESRLEVYTIGFTQKTAAEFFETLKAARSSACSTCG